MKIHPHDFFLEDLVEVLWEDSSSLSEHLKQCPVCQGRLRSLALPPPEPVAGATAQLLRWPEASPETVQPVDRDPVTELESNPEAHLRTRRMLELLVARSLAQEGRDPDFEEELARKALELARHLNGRSDAEELQDLRALAWASIGNARRQKFDLEGAEESFEAAFSHLRQGARKGVSRIQILRRLASLRKDQRRFDDALRLLRQALEILPDEGEELQRLTLMVKIANVQEEAGRPEEALPVLFETLQAVDPEKVNPRLLLAAKHNLVTCLCGLGRVHEAREVLDETGPLYDRFPDSWVQHRRAWAEAKIRRGLGDPASAESLFLTAREGFLAGGRDYDVALVSLDLASLYAEQGRGQDLIRIALEIFPAFSSRRIDRETRASLALLGLLV